MQINGQPISTAAGSTLSQLLAQQGFDVARVAVELNGKIICRSDFSKVQLADSDTIEVVQFVGGGYKSPGNSFQQHWLNGTDRNASSICTPPVSVSPV